MSGQNLKSENIKALFANKKSRNIILFTSGGVLAVFVIAIALVGSPRNGPPVPPSNTGAKIAPTPMVEARQQGEMDPAYRARFESQNLVQAEVAEKEGGSAMLRIADDIKPRHELKNEGTGLQISRSPSATSGAQNGAGSRPGAASTEAAQIHPAVMSLIGEMRPVTHQAHAGLVALPAIVASSDGVPPSNKAAEDKKKEIGEVFYNAGEIVAATITNTMNSDAPGVALATIHTGKLAGAKLIGTYVSVANGRGVSATYTKLSTQDGRLFNIQAKALSESELSEIMASSTDHKILNRFVVRPIAYFMRGMAQAIQTTTRGSNTTYNGASNITTINQNKATATEQLRMAAGMVGDAIVTEVERPENMTPTSIVNQNEVFALVFMDRVAQINAI